MTILSSKVDRKTAILITQLHITFIERQQKLYNFSETLMSGIVQRCVSLVVLIVHLTRAFIHEVLDYIQLSSITSIVKNSLSLRSFLKDNCSVLALKSTLQTI